MQCVNELLGLSAFLKVESGCWIVFSFVVFGMMMGGYAV